NEAARRQEKKDREQLAFTLENKRRSGKGIEPFATVEAYKKDKGLDKDEEEQAAEAAAKEPESRIDPDKDALLMESGYILADFIRLQTKTKSKQIAKTNTLTKAN
ncbi:MAG: carboxy terminal-processing peptidase, partial [Cellvibrionaceae bacterium]|nr:carboxy terminal-processing peptidase [Cellvibrionaceae bacterium]